MPSISDTYYNTVTMPSRSDDEIREEWVSQVKDFMNYAFGEEIEADLGEKEILYHGAALNKWCVSELLSGMQAFCGDDSLTWDHMLDNVTPEQFKNAFDEAKQGNSYLRETEYYEVLLAMGINSRTLAARKDGWRDLAEDVQAVENDTVENDTVENDTPSAAHVPTSDENTGCPPWLIPLIVALVILCGLGLWRKLCKKSQASNADNNASTNAQTQSDSVSTPPFSNSSGSGSFLQRY